MQELMQGEGIIDIVNTYVSIGLRSGLVGLSLFLGIFLSAMFRVWRRMNQEEGNTGMRDIGRAILATMTCILVSFYTVSSITFIPVIYYLVAGLAVAYARSERALAGAEQPRPEPVSPSGRRNQPVVQGFG